VALAFAFAALPPTVNAQITPLLAINGSHTVTVSNDKETILNEAISGNTNAILNIEGHGRIALTKNSNTYLGRVFIRGAEFVNNRTGFMGKARSFTIQNGGILVMDNSGAVEVDYIGPNGEVTLSGGTLRIIGRTLYNPFPGGEDFAILSLTGGANTIDIHNKRADTITNIHPTKTFTRSGTATLNLTGNRIYSSLQTPDSILFRYATTSSAFTINNVIPWATMSGTDWATSVANSGEYYLVALNNYHAGAQNTWQITSNLNLVQNETLTAHRTINSLRMRNDAFVLNLGKKHTLHINSGGILTTGDNIQVTGSGKLTSLGHRPLYIHTYGRKFTFKDQTTLGDEARKDGVVDLVKTGTGELILNSEATHRLDTVTINQGVIKLLKGWLSIAGRIILGDGAGIDTLELAAASKNRIIKTGGGSPSITLHGNPYGPASDEAILRFGGGTQQQLTTLYIQDRGTIDFASGSKSAPNILYIDQLTFNNRDARLTIRNWNYETDYLLVRYKNGNPTIPAILNQIHFEGFDSPALWHWHFLKDFGDYWQITAVPAPELSTTGTILGAAGIGLWGWRNRKERRKSQPKNFLTHW